MRIFLTLTFVIAASAAFFSQQRIAAQPSFRSTSSELVVLPVIVTDKRGRFVSDLPRDRFVVYDEGRRQDVSLFSDEETPVTIGLVIDSSGSMRTKLPLVQAATMMLVKLSNPQDEIFTVTFNDTAHEALPGRRLLAANLPELAAALNALVPEGRTALYDALLLGLKRVAAGTRPRKILILMSDGADNASRATLKEVLARARYSNAAIYTIGLFDRDDPDQNAGVLKSLARSTGAERFLPNSPGLLLQACERIAREIRSGYTIAYVPPDRDGAYHRVKVQIEPADPRRLTLRTRPGYFAADPLQP